MSTEPAPGDAWQADELDLLLDAYFQLMMDERSGGEPVKADLNRRLQSALPARSRGSIEYKLQNVSAVLDDLGKPWIDGYKPAPHYQAALKPAAARWLRAHSAIAEALESYGDEVPSTPAVPDLEAVFVPVPGRAPKRTGGKLHLSRGDWGALKDARNRALGAAGEEWVIALERAVLMSGGRNDLAGQVEWVSRTLGDGLGYDVLSFSPDGAEKLIEVKTTNMGPRSPFYLTRREVAVSRAEERRYRLYRVFDFARNPRLFTLTGSLSEQLELEPLLYHARV
jgi:hypothetical protein